VLVLALGVAGALAPRWPHIPGAPQETSALAEMAGEWRAIGTALSGLANQRPPVVIAVTAAGAVPFYSDLESVDLLGLTDAWIARHGAPILSQTPLAGSRPGHARIATAEYVERRSVHLLLNHPWLVRRRLPAHWTFSRAAS